uniref:Uncharacterized protein n=1 Tax=Vibrio splendidus TaxID=29497 RepID=A0A0H3ZKW2_VIBSP|nr:hypothetical protein [Vibrio splendidus]
MLKNKKKGGFFPTNTKRNNLPKNGKTTFTSVKPLLVCI